MSAVVPLAVARQRFAQQFGVSGFEFRNLAAAPRAAPAAATQHLDDRRLPRFAPLRPAGPPPACTGRPPRSAGFSASAAKAIGARRVPNQESAAVPAAATCMNPRRERELFFHGRDYFHMRKLVVRRCRRRGVSRARVQQWHGIRPEDLTSCFNRCLQCSPRPPRNKAVGGQWAVVGGRWAVVGGQWSVGGGRWAVGGGRWAVAVGGGRWAVGSGRWSVVSGRWSVVGGQWALVNGH